ALLVFHHDSEITEEDREKITTFSKWLASDERPDEITSTLPYHEFPEEVQEQLYSEDGTTLLFNVTLEEGLESSDANQVMDDIRLKVEELALNDLQFEITGPAGISADTVTLFKNADLVLMIATVVLIFIILIVIYRSPLLAITPLIIAAIVYGFVDRVIGIFGAGEVFTIDSQAVSIMLVLLFAVLTDYSLFVFSRYREELKKNESKYASMEEAMYHVSEPIFFSGGTVFLAMLALFVTVFKPYNHFAPVFSIAVVVILIAGLTLIPSVFALMGRKAFWPFIPKVATQEKKKRRFWTKISKLVQKRPALLSGILVIIFAIGAFNFTTINYSFNLLKSFPDDISSRVGFELLEENYPAGELAPVTMVMEANEAFELDETFLHDVNEVIEAIEQEKGIDSISPNKIENLDDLPRNFLADNHQAVKLQIILEDNPY